MTTDEAALQALVEQMQDAWNRADSSVIASLFADDADFIHILGGYSAGREAIEIAHRQIFDTIFRGSHIDYRIEKLRFLRPDLAALLLVSTLNFYRDRRLITAQSRPTLIAEKKENHWRVLVYQNTRIAGVDTPGAEEELFRDHPSMPRKAA